jgi:hypothetical protein
MRLDVVKKKGVEAVIFVLSQVKDAGDLKLSHFSLRST